MIDEGKEIEVNCHFCNHNYQFSIDELKELLTRKSLKPKRAGVKTLALVCNH